MSFVSAIIKFFVRKVAMLAVVLVALFGAWLAMSALVPELREAEGVRDRLVAVEDKKEAETARLVKLKNAYDSKTIEGLEGSVPGEIERRKKQIEEAAQTRKRNLEKKDEACGFIGKTTDFLTPGSACEKAQQALEASQAALRTSERSLAAAQRTATILRDPELSTAEKAERLRGIDGGAKDATAARDITTSESRIKALDAEAMSLEKAQNSWAGWVVRKWSQSWRWLLGIALVVLLTPPIARALGFFVVMPAVSRTRRTIRLADANDHPDAAIEVGEAERSLTLDLPSGTTLTARSEFLRPVRGETKSKLIYDWKAPSISFAAGLHSLTRVIGTERSDEATLASPDDPSIYLMRIDFTDHPGVVMRPRHVVGVVGEPDLRTRWQWGIHALATWQVRYILFSGSGGLIVQGGGDVRATTAEKPTNIDQHLTMGFDSRLVGSVRRSKAFWSYLMGRSPLVDDEFTGPYPYFWQKSNSKGPGNESVKAFNTVLTAVGKLFGF